MLKSVMYFIPQSNFSKTFNQLPLKEFDYVVSMGCQDVCPIIPGKRHIEWNIEDPKGKGIESFRKTRDIIKDEVSKLIEGIQDNTNNK